MIQDFACSTVPCDSTDVSKTAMVSGRIVYGMEYLRY